MNLIQKIQQFKEICGLDQYENFSEIDSGHSSTERRAVSKHHRHENDTEVSVRESETMTTNAERKRRHGGLIEIIMQPQNLAGGQIKSYQMESLQWLLNIHQYSEMYQQHFPNSDPNKYQINAILADEMGLGKTIQTLSLLTAVYEQFGIRGPHMIIVPKSTLPQWHQEQEKWCPMFKLQEVIGEASERAEQLKTIQAGGIDLILTTYDVLRLETRAFQRMQLQYVVMDEGHKLKSQETQVCGNIKSLRTRHKLLLTGTPIQNDVHELWSLLNVLMPYIFDSAEQFVQILSEQQNLRLLQEILSLFILRREKRDVERLPPKHEFVITCPMTSLQKKLYKAILLKDQTQLREATAARSAETARTSLTNIMMQLRKCADHPYLFRGVEPEPQVDGEHIVNVSGKMVLMCALIQKIVSANEKVLVFCQMTSLLNIIEDYFLFKNISYVRIDGSTELKERARAIRVFSGPETSVFLLSTRAGALGLNLTAANHVIIYQQDNNPQVDLQAVGRAYRLLQKKEVYVYRLLTENSVDFRIYERACLKLRLDDVVMKSANFSGQQIKQLEKKQAKSALMDIIQFGSEQLFTESDQINDQFDYNQPEIVFSTEKLEKLLQSGRKQQQDIQNDAEEKEREFDELVKNLAADGKLEAADIANMYQFEGVDFKKLTDRLQQEKLKAQIEARRALLERQEAQQQQQKELDGRDYPTISKFRFSQFYRPDFFFLDQRFYELQQKVMDEIQNVIVPAFKGSNLKSYDEYLEQISTNKQKALLYTDKNIPGLTEQELLEYYEFLEQQCPALGNQYMSRKEYQLIMQSIQDLEPEEKPLKYGLRRVAMGDEMKTVQKSLGFSTDKDLQQEYSFGILPSSKSYSIAKPKKFDFDQILNFKHAYSIYTSYQPELILTEEVFVNYCMKHSKAEDKIQKIFSRKKANLEKYNTVFQLVDVENPMQNMLLVRPNQAKKTFRPIHDKFLICWVSMFGFNEYKQCSYFINVTPMFQNDYWFRLRHHDELKERVDKLVKLNMKTQVKIENE